MAPIAPMLAMASVPVSPMLSMDAEGYCVRLSDVQAPNSTASELKYAQEMHHLVIQHGLAKVLNEEHLAIGVLCQRVENTVHNNGWDVRVGDIFLHVQHSHGRIIAF